MLSLHNCSFNEIICISHFYLAHTSLFYVIDSTIWCFTWAVFDSLSMSDDVLAFESGWLGQFCPSTAVLGDQTFNNEVLTTYLSSLNIEFKPVPLRRHEKNTPESKHGPIRSGFLRLTRNGTSNLELVALRAERISNDLYGSDIL